MKPFPFGPAIAVLFSATGVANAVTVTVNSLIASTTGSSGTITDTTAPGSSTQALLNSGSITATAPTLGVTDMGGGSWEFNGLSTASLAASRGGSGANTAQTAAGQAAYQIAFTLGAGESAMIYFDLGYSLSETDIDGTVSWNFTGPSGSIAAISGNVGGAGNQNVVNQNISQQQALITAPGTYTFNLSGAMASQTTNKSESLSLSLNSIGFDIVAIPEPSVALLGLSSAAICLFRRRRNPV